MNAFDVLYYGSWVLFVLALILKIKGLDKQLSA